MPDPLDGVDEDPDDPAHLHGLAQALMEQNKYAEALEQFLSDVHWGPLDYLGPHQGWTVNFLSFGAVYVVAMLLWLRFDATRPVVQDV